MRINPIDPLRTSLHWKKITINLHKHLMGHTVNRLTLTRTGARCSIKSEKKNNCRIKCLMLMNSIELNLHMIHFVFSKDTALHTHWYLQQCFVPGATFYILMGSVCLLWQYHLWKRHRINQVMLKGRELLNNVITYWQKKVLVTCWRNNAIEMNLTSWD